ncbi:MAG: methylated-DNA--[protein]-cysteine S-methyltransferase [Planctomycetes bacterium]|nr:methylated-DNA--[protein]-cysteine S-methyltransferase [Planctomycetota bacterium]
MRRLPPVREMEQAVRRRDPAYDGIFFIGVRTTGIFCRPNCPARRPLARNIEYFPLVKDALFAGYRPCKRCTPLALDRQPPWAARLLADVEAEPARRITESDLRERGVDPATARRHFLRRFGMTFHAFSRARRLGRALHHIRNGGDLDGAVLESGYESHSGFRDAFARVFGTSPGRGRGRAGECVRIAWIESPLGPLLAGATAEGVCLLEFTDRRMLEAQLASVRRAFAGQPAVPGENEHLARLREELADYFARSLRRFTTPLVYPGTDFQVRVWEQLLRIPYGETRSYDDIARAVGDANARRAVGRANGLNRIAIVIPCHRVVNKDGRLGGYGGGLRRKQFLLDLERGTAPE